MITPNQLPFQPFLFPSSILYQYDETVPDNIHNPHYKRLSQQKYEEMEHEKDTISYRSICLRVVLKIVIVHVFL